MAELKLEDVDSMDLEAGSEWLEEREIPYEQLETLGEILELIKNTLKTDSQKPNMNARRNDARIIADAVERHSEMNSELRMLYGDLISFMDDVVGEELLTLLDTTYEHTVECLETNISDLTDRTCSIVVAGESSAGKSSFLNLLLGTKVLPYSLLSTTSVICRIKNCPEKSFKVINMNGNVEEIKVSGEGKQAEEDLISKLEPYVGRTAGYKPPQDVHHVDILWPLPILKDNITIVDTPGVGESREMTQKLVDYLPNATAFIYIVNSANAGGIQEDTVLKIISEQREQNTDSNLATFDPKCMIFVCNKWDIVEKRGEAAKTWDDTIRKLQMTIPGLPQDQIFRMSVTEADRYLQSGLGYTEKYKNLLDGLEKLVPASLECNVKRHFRWLDSFLQQMQSLIASRINNAKNTVESNAKMKKTTLSRLEKLKCNSLSFKNDLTTLVKEQSAKIKHELSLYLQTPKVRQHIETWLESEVPDMVNDDIEETAYRARFKIRKRIVLVIQKWCTDKKPYDIVIEELKIRVRKECQLMEKECKDIESVLTGTTTEANEKLLLGRPKEDDEEKNDDGVTTTGKVALVLAGLWIPVGLATVIVSLPVIAGVVAVGSIKQKINAKKMKKQYTENKVEQMKYWSTYILSDILQGDKMKYLVEKLFMSDLLEAVNTLCSDFVPRQIERDKLLLKNITDDKRSMQDILDEFQPLKKKTSEHIGKLNMFHLKYYAEDKIDISEISLRQKIGMGSFSDVFSADWSQKERKQKVAIKIFKDHDLYHMLEEVNCSRLFRHQNIVTYYGVINGNGNKALGNRQRSLHFSENQIMLVQELCDDTLESLVFQNKNLQCGSFDTGRERCDALEFYTRMAISVCEGLTYIHCSGFMHRDLKLSNILIKDGVAKLSDLGFARNEVIMTSSIVGTPTHMAPELFEEKPYTYSADIYSLGIVLWELWYGQHPYSKEIAQGFVKFVHQITHGKRPECDLKSPMIPELQVLVKQCWHENPSYRPPVERVTQELKEIKRVNSFLHLIYRIV